MTWTWTSRQPASDSSWERRNGHQQLCLPSAWMRPLSLEKCWKLCLMTKVNTNNNLCISMDIWLYSELSCPDQRWDCKNIFTEEWYFKRIVGWPLVFPWWMPYIYLHQKKNNSDRREVHLPHQRCIFSQELIPSCFIPLMQPIIILILLLQQCCTFTSYIETS